MIKITQKTQLQILFICLLFCSTTVFAQVGIGTNNPTSTLDVEVNAAVDGIDINNVAGNGDPRLRWQVNGTSIISMGIDDSDADKFKIGTTALTNNTRLTIQTNGYIGIGTTAPTRHLQMQANRDSEYIASYENTHVNGSSLMGYINSGNYNALGGVTNIATGLGSYGVSLPNNGASIGVWGTSNSSDAIGVYGTVPTTGSWLGYGGVFTGGLGYLNGLYNLSDERVKSNIEHIDNALFKLSKINGIRYNYNLEKYNYLAGGDQKTYLGFSAQNIKSVFPEAVTEKLLTVSGPEKKTANANMSDYKKEIFNVVDYTALIPVTVEAIKEQQQIIESQNDKIKTLEKKLADLEAKVNSLLEN